MSSESKITLAIPELLAGFVNHLESYCQYGCCGLDVFNFEPNHTQAWVQERGPAQARLALQQAQDLRFRILADPNFDRFEIPSPLDIVEVDLKLLLAAVETNLTAALATEPGLSPQ